MFLTFVFWFFSFSVLGCSPSLTERASQAADAMCGCTDLSCAQKVSDSIINDPDLSQLSDPAMVRARYGDQPELVAAVDRFMGCRQKLVPGP